MSETPRFFVDERGGCIAVRDRRHTDPDYPGLHPYTQGVIWFSMGFGVDEVWGVTPQQRNHAHHLVSTLEFRSSCATVPRPETNTGGAAAPTNGGNE